jgi:phosphatidylinositol glycan class O
VLIDALRFDFAQWSDSVDPQTAFNYQNKLARLHRRLRSMDQHTRLLRLHADAPTVTMQRLKAITTGSLPTFLDIRNNFDSERIDEDNLISQLASFGNLTLIGDDTWLNLYPTSFARAHAYPSFDVQDLHTVDNGCQMHLPTALNDTSSLLTVVHFLGMCMISLRLT